MTDGGIGSQKRVALQKLMAEVGLREEDLLEKFVRASGPGGQHVNKTASAVYLRHLPSGREVKVQQARSQLLNRYYARLRLAEALRRARDGEQDAQTAAAEKIRRQKRRRSRRSKAKSVADKRLVGAKKRGRRPPNQHSDG